MTSTTRIFCCQLPLVVTEIRAEKPKAIVCTRCGSKMPISPKDSIYSSDKTLNALTLEKEHAH